MTSGAAEPGALTGLMGVFVFTAGLSDDGSDLCSTWDGVAIRDIDSRDSLWRLIRNFSGCAGATGEAMVDRGLLTCAISRGDCAWLDNSAPDSAEAFPDEVKTRLA
jgi:hypothetical protein